MIDVWVPASGSLYSSGGWEWWKQIFSRKTNKKKWWFPMVIFYQGNKPGSYDWQWGRWGEVGIPGLGNRKCENTVADGVASILSPSASKGFWELRQRFWHHQGVMFAVSIWNTTGISREIQDLKSRIWNGRFIVSIWNIIGVSNLGNLCYHQEVLLESREV